MLQGRDGTFYCWQGAATKYRMVSDDRLQIRVAPVWLEVSYQTTDIARARDGSCEGVL